MISQRRRSFTATLEAGVAAVILGRDDDGSGGAEGVLNGGHTAQVSISASQDSTISVDLQVTRGAPWVRLSTSYPVAAGSSRALSLFDLAGAHAVRLVGLAAAPSSLSVAWSAAG